MSKKIWLAALLCCSTTSLYAVDLEIALSGDTANIKLLTESETMGFSGSDLSAEVFFNDEDDFAVAAGLLVDGTPAGDQPFTYGLGGKLYYVNLDNPSDNASALALGFGVKYHIPARMPIAIGGDAYFAPDITTFGDGESLMDLRVIAEIGVLPNAAAFVGYRQFEVDLENGGDYELDDNAHIGISFQF